MAFGNCHESVSRGVTRLRLYQNAGASFVQAVSLTYDSRG